jgi:formamidopyrimidine-DNA glycosylase
MPELPEVESVARALRLSLLDRQLTGLRVRFPGVLSQPVARTRRALLGRRLADVHRHGKYLLLTFVDGERPPSHLMIHLRMTGQIFVLPSYHPDRHVHLVLDFSGLKVFYRDIRKFGRFTLVESALRPAALAHVGPDMLAVRFRSWQSRVAGRRAPIKAVLLNQGVAAGLGNIYADEALFRARIHPAAPCAALTRQELARLLAAAKSVLRLAIRHGGTTFMNFVDFDGRPGNFRRRLRVYGRTGEPCPRCAEPIARLVIAGRSSHFCPRCQTSPASTRSPG